MKTTLISAVVLMPILLGAQTPNTGTLMVVDEEGFNDLSITIAAIGASDTQISQLTGTVNATFNIDPTTGTTGELTITGGTLVGSDTTFSFLFNTTTLTITGLEGTVITISPPGIVDPATGFFEADQHLIEVNDGTITGTGLASSVDRDVANEPFSDVTEGTGTVVLIPMGEDFETTITVPITLTETIDITDDLSADITITGTIKARGIVTAPQIDPYVQWAVANGIGDVPSTDFTLTSFASNRMIYALGYDAATLPSAFFTNLTEGLELALGTNTVREPVMVEFSETLEFWNPAPAAQIVEGQTTLPTGFSGRVVLARPGNRGFYRLFPAPVDN